MEITLFPRRKLAMVAKEIDLPATGVEDKTPQYDFMARGAEASQAHGRDPDATVPLPGEPRHRAAIPDGLTPNHLRSHDHLSEQWRSRSLSVNLRTGKPRIHGSLPCAQKDALLTWREEPFRRSGLTGLQRCEH